MSDGPFAIARRRLGRAIDWRVEAAVERSASARDEHVREEVAALDRERLELLSRVEAGDEHVREEVAPLERERLELLNRVDALERFELLGRVEALEVQTEQLDAAVEGLRLAITSLSVSVTDAHRAQGELLARLARNLDELASGPAIRSQPSAATSAK